MQRVGFGERDIDGSAVRERVVDPEVVERGSLASEVADSERDLRSASGHEIEDQLGFAAEPLTLPVEIAPSRQHEVSGERNSRAAVAVLCAVEDREYRDEPNCADARASLLAIETWGAFLDRVADLSEEDRDVEAQLEEPGDSDGARQVGDKLAVDDLGEPLVVSGVTDDEEVVREVEKEPRVPLAATEYLGRSDAEVVRLLARGRTELLHVEVLGAGRRREHGDERDGEESEETLIHTDRSIRRRTALGHIGARRRKHSPLHIKHGPRQPLVSRTVHESATLS